MPRQTVAKERRRRILSERMREFHERRRLQKQFGLKQSGVKSEPQSLEKEYVAHEDITCIPASWMQPSEGMGNTSEAELNLGPEPYSPPFNHSLRYEPLPGTECFEGGFPVEVKDHHSSIMTALLEDSTFADVTLIAQGQRIQAHKAVLSAMSPYLRDILQTNPCQHPVVIMPFDVQYQDLQAIVNFIYKGEITLPSENVTTFLKTAQGLQVTGLPQSDIFSKTTDNIPSSKNVRFEAKISSDTSTAERFVYGSSSCMDKKYMDESFSEREQITPTRTLSKSPGFINNDENFILITDIMNGEDLTLDEEDLNDQGQQETTHLETKNVKRPESRNYKHFSQLASSLVGGVAKW